MKRISYEEMKTTRIPNPACGPGIFSLDELRYYCRLFWRERKYGISHIEGGQLAFIKHCGYNDRRSFEGVLIYDPPEYEFMSSKRQAAVSRAVRMVLDGKLYVDHSMKRV